MVEGADPLMDRRPGLRKPGPEDVLQRRPRAVCPVSGDLDVAQPGKDQRDAPQTVRRPSQRFEGPEHPRMPASRTETGAARLVEDRPRRAVGRSDPIPDRREKFVRSEEHTSELQSLMRHSYAVFCLK